MIKWCSDWPPAARPLPVAVRNDVDFGLWPLLFVDGIGGEVAYSRGDRRDGIPDGADDGRRRPDVHRTLFQHSTTESHSEPQR